jgi:hypothetical protein
MAEIRIPSLEEFQRLVKLNPSPFAKDFSLPEELRANLNQRFITPMEYEWCVAPNLKSPFQRYDNMKIGEFLRHVVRNASPRAAIALHNESIIHFFEKNSANIKPLVSFFAWVGLVSLLSYAYFDPKKHEAYHYWEHQKKHAAHKAEHNEGNAQTTTGHH